MASTKKKEECSVCIDKYTSSSHKKKVQCNYCEYNCCVSCAQTYLLSQVSDAHCMNCRTGWNREFIDLNMTKTFRTKDWREHKKVMIVNREKAILPAMQRYAAAKKMIEELKDKNQKQTLINLKISSERSKINSEVSHIRTRLSSVNITEEAELEDYKKLDIKLNEASQKEIEYVKADIIMTRITNNLYMQMGIYNNTTNVEKEKKEFILKCVKEGCRGFLSSAYKCDLCFTYVCKECMIPKSEKDDDDHVCKKDDVETVKMIRKDTRPCPKCGIRISKIDGCDQMFCISEGCHTAFSWNTGKIHSGVIHNPHYYEWVRRNNNGEVPRNPNENLCNDQITYYAFYSALHNLKIPVLNVKLHECSRYFSNVHRVVTDIQAYRLPSFPQTRDADMFKELHCDFLLNNIDEAKWKQSMFLKENNFEKKQQIGIILITFVTLMNDSIRKLYDEIILLPQGNIIDIPKIQSVFDKRKNEFEEIRQYINESLINTGITMLCAVPQISCDNDKKDWSWKPIRKII